MVTTDITQFSIECDKWINTLRSYREKIHEFEKTLLKIAPQLTDKASQQDIEHFQNQFRIQLLNVHDLKHDIKSHGKFAAWEITTNNGQYSEATFVEHEDLNNRFTLLESTIECLKEEFLRFSNQYTS